MPWHALELEVDAAAAEALSEALLESGAQSVALENLERSRQRLIALIDPGTDAQGLVRAAAAAAGLAAAPAFTLGEVADEDWVRRSQAEFLPTEIGTRLWIGPTCTSRRADASRCAWIRGSPSAPERIPRPSSCSSSWSAT